MGDGFGRGLLPWMNQDTDCPECQRLRKHLQDAMTPWNSPNLAGWDLVGMNHYHVGDVRYLFVAMSRDKHLIKVEGPVAQWTDEVKLWQDLEAKAGKLR